MMLGAPGSSVMRPVVQTVRGPHNRRKVLVDRDTEFRQREPCVLADRHSRGAGMVLLAGEGDAVLPDADDGGDDADLEAGSLEPVALLDMGFEIADVPSALDRDAGAAGKADDVERLTHAAIAVAITRRVDVRLCHSTDERAAAEEGAEMAFLVAP